MPRTAGRGPEGGRGGRGGGREGGRGAGGGRGRGRRGPAKGKTIRPHDSREPTKLCKIKPAQLLNKSARTTVKAIARTRIRGAWVLWSQVEQPDRDAMYKDFRAHFHFGEDVDEETGYRSWEGYHQNQWSKWLSRMRSESNTLAGLPSNHEITSQHKEFKPEFIELEYWEEMVDYWSTDEVFKKRSKSMQKARSMQKVKHTGGSKPFAEHFIDLEKQLGRKATILEKFKHTHSKGGGVGEWATPECEEIANKFQSAMGSQTRTQDEGEENEDVPMTEQQEMELWIANSGGRQKNRVLGLGPRTKASEVCPRYPTRAGGSGASSSGGGPSIDEAVISRMTDEVERRVIAKMMSFIEHIPRQLLRAIVCEPIYGSTDPDATDQDHPPVILELREEARNVAAEHIASMLSSMHQADVGTQGVSSSHRYNVNRSASASHNGSRGSHS